MCGSDSIESASVAIDLLMVVRLVAQLVRKTSNDAWAIRDEPRPLLHRVA